MSEIQDYGATFRVSREMIDSPHAVDYVKHKVADMEKDAIYKAVKQAETSGGWICIKPETIEEKHPFPFGEIEYKTRIHCRSVNYAKVYVPVETSFMPPDVFKCTFCGGYTKNDMRGHCSGCGGPRDDGYLEA